MSSIKTLFFLSLLASLVSCQETRVSPKQAETLLQKLVGVWQLENEQVIEEWSYSKDSSYAALVYQYQGNEKVLQEIIRIIREDGVMYYEATVMDQNQGKPVRFELTAATDNIIAFFNPKHDFPKKIEYEFIDDDHVVATVSDGKAERGKSFQLKYQKMNKEKKVTGIGGIFFKADDPGKMRDWYRDNLGLVTNEFGSLFEFRLPDNPSEKGHLQWSPFDANTEYFEPSKKDFMINYRVENLEKLVDELKKNGVTILDSIEVYEYGKFIHILDPENNKIELWEPVRSVFTEPSEGKTTK